MNTEIDGACAPFENIKLFGHSEAEAFLAHAYRSGRMHHAILIEGEKGIGKATLAFRYANHILNHPDGTHAPQNLSDPDPDSPTFRQIAGGASHNLMHIKCETDPKTGKVKSAISVDDIRRTAKFFAQTSGSDNWRIAIVDVADDLNRSAANALLKILEEPPKRSLFLVLSHSSGRLLPTIRSRCLSLKLRPLDDKALTAALRHLGAIDGLNGANLARLLELSEGSVARALTILNYGGAELIEVFKELIDPSQTTDRKQLHKLADSLAGKDQDVNYHFLIEHMINHVMAEAKQAASYGAIGQANHYAALSEEMMAQKADADTYNLDKKQTLLTLFSMLEA